MTFLTLTLLSLACWRMTHLVVSDEAGPWDVLETLRFYGRRVGLGGLISCPWCSSLWLAGLLCLTLRARPLDWLIWTLAVSGAAMLAWRHGNG